MCVAWKREYGEGEKEKEIEKERAQKSSLEWVPQGVGVISYCLSYNSSMVQVMNCSPFQIHSLVGSRLGNESRVRVWMSVTGRRERRAHKTREKIKREERTFGWWKDEDEVFRMKLLFFSFSFSLSLLLSFAFFALPVLVFFCRWALPLDHPDLQKWPSSQLKPLILHSTLCQQKSRGNECAGFFSSSSSFYFFLPASLQLQLLITWHGMVSHRRFRGWQASTGYLIARLLMTWNIATVTSTGYWIWSVNIDHFIFIIFTRHRSSCMVI